ncbi:MAG: exosortase/archaeosortase family protein [Deltaproteobacteria bacterium]|nr:exosortase/archaeosortase family protein [Deltaproteobacteria bacterium]
MNHLRAICRVPRPFSSSRRACVSTTLAWSTFLLASAARAGAGGGTAPAGGRGVGTAMLVDGDELLVAVASVATGLLLRRSSLPSAPDAVRALAGAAVAAIAMALAGFAAGPPGALLMLATGLVVAVLARRRPPPDAAGKLVSQHAPLLTLPIVVALLAAAPVLDGALTAAFARATALVLGVGGADAVVDGTTVHGLGAPLYVTTACAGTLVTVMPYAVAVLAGALVTTTVASRWRFAWAFVGVAAAVNLARIVLVGAVLRLAGVEAALVAHEVVGWVIAAALYGGLAFAAVRLHRRGVVV